MPKKKKKKTGAKKAPPAPEPQPEPVPHPALTADDGQATRVPPNETAPDPPTAQGLHPPPDGETKIAESAGTTGDTAGEDTAASTTHEVDLADDAETPTSAKPAPQPEPEPPPPPAPAPAPAATPEPAAELTTSTNEDLHANQSERGSDRGRDRDSEANKHRQMVVLIGGFLCWMFGAQLTTPARSEMILLAFNHDTAAAAALVGTLSSISSMIGLFGNPLIGSLSDTLGRRPVLIFGAGFSILRHGVLMIRPSVASIVISDLLAPLSQVAMMVPGRSGIGDMYSSDPLRFSIALSRWSFVPAVCTIVCPTLGGYLARLSPRLPFACASALSALMGALYFAFLREPMDPAARTRFRWTSVSPLSWVELFRRGKTLRSLAIVQMLMDFTETGGRSDRGVAQVSELYQREVLQWDVVARAQYRSAVGIFRTPGTILCEPFIRLLGLVGGFQLGLLNYFGQSLLFALTGGLASSASAAFMWSTPTALLNPLRQNTLTTLGSIEASRQGLAQGQLTGMVSSLGYFIGMTGGLFWSRLYAFGVRRGTPGIIWRVICAVQVIQMAVVAIFLRDMPDVHVKHKRATPLSK